MAAAATTCDGQLRGMRFEADIGEWEVEEGEVLPEPA